MKLALPLIALAAACAVPEESQVAQQLGCGSWGCGANSATVGDGLIFDELDSSGAIPNASGLKIIGVTAPDGRAARVYVKRHELQEVALDGSRGYSGVGLVGTIVRLQSQTTGVIYEVLVSQVKQKTITFWEGAAEWVPFYELMTRKLGATKWTDYACKNEVIDTRFTGVEHSALVFQWDRYDAAAKTVTETAAEDPWFNIACAATAPAKMHLMRHTRAGSYNDAWVIAYDTTVKQRQTMLKMLTADYCGTGHSFTTDGVPLVYNANQPWYREDTSWVAQEALWDASGALCLDNPRYATTTEIASTCGYLPPSCPSFTDWRSHAYVMSAKPSP
jgi:hypothetical protein